MKTVLAYIIVLLPISPLLVTLTVYVVGVPVAWILFWLSDRVRTVASAFCGGLAGGSVVLGYGWVVFRLLAGPASLTVWPAVATSVPLLVVIYNDLRHMVSVRAATRDLEPVLKQTMPPTMKGMRATSMAMPLGEITGLIAGWILLVEF